jgi:hypothetical protein
MVVPEAHARRAASGNSIPHSREIIWAPRGMEACLGSVVITYVWRRVLANMPIPNLR